MKKWMLVAICLLSSILVVAQNAPANSPAESQEATPSATAQNAHRPPGILGTITAINGDSMVIKTVNGQTAQISLNDKTEYRRDRQPARLGDFKTGETVFVSGTKTGDSAWQADLVATRTHAPSGDFFRQELGKRFIMGEIKSIEGTQLTILRPDGVSQTILVDETTSFRNASESITLSDLKAGDHVYGRGELKNGTFVPTVLNLGEPGVMMQQHGTAPESH